MTDSNLQKASNAHELAKTLIQSVMFMRGMGIFQGEILWELKNKNAFKNAFGKGIDTWEEFLKTPEISLSMSTANRLMKLYEFFVIKNKINREVFVNIPTVLLGIIARSKLDGEKLEEAIQAAQSLSVKDFRERFYDIQSGSAEGERTYSYMIMRKCNETKNLSKVHGVSSEEILEKFPQINV